MLLADQLLAEPKLQSRLGDGHLMTLEKWSWFLVQVQNEERAVVEAAAAELKALELPYVDEENQLTIAGLSTNLCAPRNSASRTYLAAVGQLRPFGRTSASLTPAI